MLYWSIYIVRLCCKFLLWTCFSLCTQLLSTQYTILILVLSFQNNTLNIPRTFDVFVIKIDVSASLVVIFQIIQSEWHHMSLSTNGPMRRQGVQIWTLEYVTAAVVIEIEFVILPGKEFSKVLIEFGGFPYRQYRSLGNMSSNRWIRLNYVPFVTTLSMCVVNRKTYCTFKGG